MFDEAPTDKADLFGGTQTDVATLRKFVTLQPPPVDAKWSVTTIGTGTSPGPSDTALWAVVRYSDADFATVSRSLKADEVLRPVTLRTAPAWLLAELDPARFQRGSDHVIEGSVSEGGVFASDMYSTGFAMPLSDRRILIHFSSQ